jgi:hypothetical protein
MNWEGGTGGEHLTPHSQSAKRKVMRILLLDFALRDLVLLIELSEL